jgi:hypothetical protein
MRSILDMDTVQLEITNVCNNKCSNCTRFCNIVRKPFLMTFDEFKVAVDSMVGYPKMTGIMGGEPLLHPDFEKFCNYLLSKIPKEQLGLWTSLPKGYEKHRNVIVDTFKHIFINDHSRTDIYHAPVLVGIEEVVPDKNIMWAAINHCWAQESWSASINPKGAFFCEIAASMSILFEEGDAWKTEPGWWYRIPKDFTKQMEHYCPRCGLAAPLKMRSSIENITDISPKNMKRLKLNKSDDRFSVSDLQTVNNNPPMASYKDFDYRNNIAKRYGMFLVINDQKFWTPYLYKEFKNE